jgi:POT family proton-dependent oligopeptide transporter
MAVDPKAITGQDPAGKPLQAITTDVDKAAPPPPAPLSPEGYRTAPDQFSTAWPPGVPYIVGNEACERFSFYGMRAILYAHLVTLYSAATWVASENEAKAHATANTHLFNAGVYALPMIGALLADRLAGKYRTIFYLSLVYCAGQAVLAGGAGSLWGMYLGLTLIAVGSGGIKSSVSANVGDQFGKGNWFRVRTVFQIFYFSINFGSFFATLLIPLIRKYAGGYLIEQFPNSFAGQDPLILGTAAAFAVPGILMFLATFVFWLGRRKFVHVPPKPGGRIGLLDTLSSVALFMTVGHLFFTHEIPPAYFGGSKLIMWSVLAGVSLAFLALGLYLFAVRQRLQPDDGFLAICFHVVKSHLGLGGEEDGARLDARPASADGGEDSYLARSWFWAPAVWRFGVKATEGPVAVFKIISVFFLVSIFWALFDQHSSTWIRQAQDMDLRLWGERPSFLGIPNATLEATQVPALNPLMVMILIPLMNLLYGWCDRVGLKTTPLRRITVGMLIAGLAFVAVALIQRQIDFVGKGTVWFGWQIIPYLIMTVAEVMVSITGLEFAYTQAPKKMKATVMGFWLLTVTLGNVLVAFLAGFEGLPLVDFFWVFAGLMAGAGLLFGLRALFYVPKDYPQE